MAITIYVGKNTLLLPFRAIKSAVCGTGRTLLNHWKMIIFMSSATGLSVIVWYKVSSTSDRNSGRCGKSIDGKFETDVEPSTSFPLHQTDDGGQRLLAGSSTAEGNSLMVVGKRENDYNVYKIYQAVRYLEAVSYSRLMENWASVPAEKMDEEFQKVRNNVQKALTECRGYLGDLQLRNYRFPPITQNHLSIRNHQFDGNINDDNNNRALFYLSKNGIPAVGTHFLAMNSNHLGTSSTPTRFASGIIEKNQLTSIIDSAIPGRPNRTFSVSTVDGDESFFSALDEMTPMNENGVESNSQDSLAFYQSALKQVKNHGNQSSAATANHCRILRTSVLNCKTDEEFLAKLICVRRAFDVLLLDNDKLTRMVGHGREIISNLLKVAEEAPNYFQTLYDEFITYCKDSTNVAGIKEELSDRKVYYNFYDVVLDYVLLDAFDDLANPPAAVLAVTQNRFLTQRFRKSSLVTVIGAVVRAKRAYVKKKEGFMTRFYDITGIISPVLAWGFLGSDTKFRDTCSFFKDQIMSYLSDIFSFDRVRYSSVQDLSDDCWNLFLARVQILTHRLCQNPSSASSPLTTLACPANSPASPSSKASKDKNKLSTEAEKRKPLNDNTKDEKLSQQTSTNAAVTPSKSVQQKLENGSPPLTTPNRQTLA